MVKADLRTPLGLRLYRHGIWDQDLALVGNLLSAGDVFIDGGANIGLFSLVAADRVGPGGRVLACEPVKATFLALRENLQLNGYTWVDSKQVALAEESGERPIFAFPDASGHSSFAPVDPSGAAIERVKVTTIDDLVPPSMFDRVRMIKLDIEGAELQALRGGRRLLKVACPDLMIEISPELLQRQGTTPASLRRFLYEEGYSLARNNAETGNCWFTRSP